MAFVYCWTDHKTNKLYVGYHKGDINDGYVCSSKYMLLEYNQRKDDFSRQIIAHGDVESMRVLERKILESVNAAEDTSFYNKHNANEKLYNPGGWNHTEKSKEKIGRASLGNNNTKGKKHTEDAKKKISNSLIGNKRALGNKHTEEWKADLSEKMKTADLSHLHTTESIEKRKEKMRGRTPWNKGKKGLQVAWNKGKTLSDEHKQNLRKPKLGSKE